MDRDGYGYENTDRGIERLLTDARTLSPVGIERIAWGWDRHEDPKALERFREAEKRALKAIEQADRGPEWERVRTTVLDLTEGRTSLVSWKVEHGETGHKAEHAMLGAALAIVARDRIGHDDYRTLVRPMAEGLPWLLPEEPPEPYRPARP
ncbi:MAG TPA: hypothetical protein VET65_07420 [Candidatus Limnocylindrales bacterium]|nr:hypothetical protein [Candidatus Limnocylindrales bacterium]